MKLLIFDTETNGLPRNIKSSPNFDNERDWPSIVQLSCIVYDTITGHTSAIFDSIVSIDASTTLSEESIAIHGITRAKINDSGNPIHEVLDVFFKFFETADLVIAHNIYFDISMISVELIRIINANPNAKSVSQMEMLQTKTSLYCTMKNSIKLCNIQVYSKTGGYYAKYPTLLELHQHLFGISPKKLHNSLNDVAICLRCYMKITKETDILSNDLSELNKILIELL